MARRIPTVRNGSLEEYTAQGTSTSTISIDSAAWYTWLEHHRSFCFEHSSGAFTAQKETRSAGWYWYAYQRRQGKLHTAYLGKSEELTLERLNKVAAELTGIRAGRKLQVAGGNALQADQASIIPFRHPAQPKPAPKHNLPTQLTPLIGREQEVAAVCTLLRRPSVRLLTLVGTAGVGKTRLALQVATELVDDFADGVCFISLAPVSHPEFILPAIAHGNGIDSLIDRSLVQQREQADGELRFTMFETIREYGQKCLRERGEAEDYRRAHALCYLAAVEEAEPHLKGPQQLAWLRRLEMEQRNIGAALEWLIECEEAELALRFCNGLWRFWFIRGYWSEGRRWLGAVLAFSRTREQMAERAKALCGGGVLAHRLGDVIGARSLLEEAVTLSRKLGEKRGLAESLWTLGWILNRQSDLPTARTLLEESSILARELKDRWTLAQALHWLGITLFQQHDSERGPLLLEESVALFRELGDAHSLCRSLADLAYMVMDLSNVTQARELAQESLALARQLDNTPDIARALYILGLATSSLGDDTQAATLLEESLALFRETGQKDQIAWALDALARIVAFSQGDLMRAEAYARESLSLVRELSDKFIKAVSPALLGEVKRLQGDLAQAKTLFIEGLSLAREIEDSHGVYWYLVRLAMIAAAESQPKLAARLFGSAEPRFDASMHLTPISREYYERAVESAQAQLGEKAFAAAWAEGRAMTLEQVFGALERASVLEPLPSALTSKTTVQPPPTYPHELTEREVEVLRLVAQGLSNGQIAEQLVLSRHTINAHIRSILSKLSVTSRVGATRFALEHNLT